MRTTGSVLTGPWLAVLLCVLPMDGRAVTISASVVNPGGGTGVLADISDTFAYGPFTIAYAGDAASFGDIEDVTAGDGLDESWDWSFDFRGAYDPLVFNAATTLSAARVTLRLVANGQQVQPGDAENLRVLWLPAIPVSLAQVDQEVSVSFDLLDFHTSAELMDRFASADYDGPGTIRMRFLDDVVVNFAELNLTAAAVPIPGSLPLLSLGMVGWIVLRRRR